MIPAQHAPPPPNGFAAYPQNGADGGYAYGAGVQQAQLQQHQVPKSMDNNMLRLEALVAVATSEENVAAAR